MNLLESMDIKELFSKKDVQIYTAIAVIFLSVFGGYYIYQWHNNRIQAFAQKAFSESMDVYKQALAIDFTKNDKSKSKETIWDEVELAFKTGYEQNKSSTLAPFFLAYKSIAQQKLGKNDEAFKTLDDAIKLLPSSSAYINLYKVKQALIEFDTLRQAQGERGGSGVERLDKLVQDKNNAFRDMAAYYLAEYYMANNNIEKAKEYYKIAQEAGKDSSWEKLAKLKLEKLK